ncbi:OPT family small oligopeptide transporter [Exophiala mesophila]|uniref:OPT family small oligopeptide transporter n=1 Tax=Exophiala mesophila TaxID=212818 RepID=A0A0D1WM11_EXOME|nr:OPT family small oligopeptide transporter [Exophiala mesophila]KIV90000.1 OPT family small oligopeptide transporter [Exophiala mesophila]
MTADPTSTHSTTASHPPSHHSSDLELVPLQNTSLAVAEQDDHVALADSEPHSHPGHPLHTRDIHQHSSSSPSSVTTPSQPQRPTGVLSRVWHAVMSRNPLLIRSSPALGTGSYGAVPLLNARSDSDASSDNDTENDTDNPPRSIRRSKKSRGKRLQSAHDLPDAHGHFADPRRMTRSTEWLRKRSASNASEVGMGLDSKTSFAINPDMTEGKAESSNASTRTGGSGSEVEIDYTPSAEDPPDNSPYPEVRASVPATDNTSLSINTPRMWTLSLIFAIGGSATNLFFSLRYPSVAITPVIALVLVHPMGLMWDFFLKRKHDQELDFVDGTLQKSGPEYAWTTTRQRLRLWLSQGRWNEKEHACVYISSNVSFGFAFATDVIVEQHKFYKQEVPILYQLLLTISTQILGYAFAGLTRRFLVRPAAMIWPGTLMSTAMFTTMHKNENKMANGWSISRYRFFIYVWAVAFFWYFVPGLLMPALSYFNVITWFAPKNVVVSNLFGVASGLGLFPVTFDWAQIAYIGSPLLTPWWAAANVLCGLGIVMWIAAPILYYKNVLFSGYLPILSSAVFDNRGKMYDVSKILTPDFLFDKDAYDNYSKVYLPITYVLSYGVQFASLTALITHTTCWHGKDIWRQSKQALSEKQATTEGYQTVPTSENEHHLRRIDSQQMRIGGEDVHNRLMRRYKDVPMLWYLGTFVSMLAVGIFVVEYYPVHLPWYGLLLALGITTVLFIPVGIVMAITNQHSSLYLICQLICGVIFPGRPVANMVFVTYCYISSAQGIKFSSDLKLGHYMKIPPMLLFKVQMAATLVSSLVQIGVLNWMFANIPGICTPYAMNGFKCPIAQVHFNGSILWGVVGPQRFFGPGAMYRPLVWAFLVGFLAPIGAWILGRKNKKSMWRKVNFPVLFGSLSWIPPATGLNFSIWGLVCFAFNHVVRRRAPGWWGKYTMTMSAALDSGLAISVVVIFFGFAYPGLMNNFKWWGTEIYKQGCDWQACPWIKLEPGEKFGG